MQQNLKRYGVEKLLLQLLKKEKDDYSLGFTLLELLTVIIIIGVLASIALPSFLNQANKAKQVEAKTYIGSMNRTQQAYYMEKGGFASELGELGLGVAPETANYSYTIALIDNGAENLATSKFPALKSYTGCVKLSVLNEEATTVVDTLESPNATPLTCAAAPAPSPAPVP
jgi:type IV pilus assembly protein PilA